MGSGRRLAGEPGVDRTGGFDLRDALCRNRSLGFLVLSVSSAALILAACSSTRVQEAPSASAVVAALSQSQSSTGAGQVAPANSSGTTRRNQGGSVTIDVTWENPGDTTGALTFSVAMDTHSVELDGIDLGKLAVLRNDQGVELRPQEWDAPPGGHHRSGILLFPARDGAGKPILGTGARSLEMVIRDVAGVKERVLRWEVS